MDYSQLSDFEVNRMVGDVICKGHWACKPETSGNDTEKWYYGNADTTFEPLRLLPDYCNDWSATGPIIFSNLISVEPDYEFIDPTEEESFASGLWISEYFDGKNKSMRYADPSPLRAAMIVFLMMQDSKHA